jgi:hypothetical protein
MKKGREIMNFAELRNIITEESEVNENSDEKRKIFQIY